MTDSSRVSRRGFFKVAGAGAALAGAGRLTHAAESEAGQPPLPTRKLGRSGVEISMLNLGSTQSSFSPRLVEMAWRLGIRYIDAAAVYRGGDSERDVAKWLARYPERRKELFLVSKDHPRNGPREMLEQIDRRLEACGTDYLDLFFVHMLSDRDYGNSGIDPVEWPRSAEFKAVAEQLKKSGKAKLVGFSTHDSKAAEQMLAAAEGGFVDAIMMKYRPFAIPDEMNRALDACHKAGIGLIAMKSMRGHETIPRRVPDFDALGLSTAQAWQHAIWSDERIASICSKMENVNQLEENCAAARKYQGPLPSAASRTLLGLVEECGETYCPNCDGRCARAAGRPELALNDIARYVNYYEVDGELEARELYRRLSDAERSTDGADLSAAREACQCKLDFDRIVRKAQRYFG